MNILILEDDEMARLGLSLLISSHGKVTEFTQAKLLLNKIETINADIAFVDLDLEEDLIGLEVIKALSEKNVYTVALTGREDEQIIATAYELGASDYLVKPITEEQVDFIFNNFRSKKISFENFNIVQDELEKIQNAILSNQRIIIKGETGTGKTKLAKKIHEIYCQMRDLSVADVPFVSVNCSELSASLFESEMFGHKKGAFTGAIENKVGRIEQACNGILFLDEIGSISLAAQTKLLKVIDEGLYFRVGDSAPKQANFFLVTATCEDIDEKIKNGIFREDFYFRIIDVPITLQSFSSFSRVQKEKVINEMIKSLPRRIVLAADALDLICRHEWPGNLRELDKFFKKISLHKAGVLTVTDLQTYLEEPVAGNVLAKVLPNLMELSKQYGLPKLIEEIEKQVIKQTFLSVGNKSRKTIDILKISNNLFYKYIEKNQE